MIEYTYNKSDKYYNIHFRSEINVAELINITRIYVNLKDNNIKIIADFRKSNIDISVQEIEIFGEKILKFKSESKIRVAIIQEDPILTAYTMLLIDKWKQPRVNIKLFSTNQAAENWILL